MKKKIELDPDDREWEYDGDGRKIYKLKANKPVKTDWIEEQDAEPHSINLNSRHDERFLLKKLFREGGDVPHKKEDR